MILINDVITTKVTVESGEKINGTIAYSDFVGNPKPTITGQYVIDPVIENINVGTGFDFVFSVASNATSFAVTFDYYDFDGKKNTETLDVVIDDTHKPRLTFLDGTTAKTQTHTSQGGEAEYIIISDNIYDLNVKNSAPWIINRLVPIEGQDNRYSLGVIATANGSMYHRDGEIIIYGKNINDTEARCKVIVMQEPAAAPVESEFSVLYDKITVPAIIDDGESIVELDPIYMRKKNIASVEATTNADYYSLDIQDNEIYLVDFRNNNSPYERVSTVTITAHGTNGNTFVNTVNVLQLGKQGSGSIKLNESIYTVGPQANINVEVIAETKNVYVNTLSLEYDEVYDNYINITKFETSFIISCIYGNDTNRSKIYDFVLVGYDYVGNRIEVPFQLIQQPADTREEFPIWKWEIITYDTQEDFINYQLVNDDTGEVVYVARAYAINGKIEIEINSIIKNYLNEILDIDREGWQDNNAYVTMRLMINGDDYKTYCVYNDWSYEDRTYSSFVSDPVSNVIDYRQMYICSVINRQLDEDSTARFKVTVDGISDGNVQYLDNQIMSYTIKDLSDSFNIVVENIGTGEEMRYKVDCTNNKYCLYYLNAYGGYDSMLFLPQSIKSTTVSNNEYTRNEYDYHKHSLVQYEKQLVEQWQLKSGLLTDEQSIKIQHLLTSPQIWLQDLDTNIFTPVVITDTNVQEKMRMNQSRKPYTYSITVKSSKNKLRR